ncbi:hypothetical protein THTE_4226 [Thermogutta terrifontis]|uniref:Uncharacterized protein n=1 Tax=Thermogutta terrifontis TaxID=1331910 RepID=A0A286RLP6_9BACT|nr:hypothetical protein THTE_4226 [Thermogutta terrifontis]
MQHALVMALFGHRPFHLLRGGEIVGCHFKEEFPDSIDGRWLILVDGSRVGREKPTVVDGPHVRWGSPRGRIGVIPPSK